MDEIEGYITIPEKHWPCIEYGMYVRYIGKDGQLRIGGFVLKNPLDTQQKRFIKLQNSFNKNQGTHCDWVVAYEDIESMYAKPSAVALTTQDDMKAIVATLNANNRALLT